MAFLGHEIGRHSRRAAAGFGLLEAIVALTLLASTGLALFAWINQNLQSASRLRVIEQEARLQLSAQALIETVNPAQAPTGKLAAGPMLITWEAAPIEPARTNAAFGEAPSGAWRVGLYRLQVQARDPSRGLDIHFEQWRVGTERLQPVSEVLP